MLLAHTLDMGWRPAAAVGTGNREGIDWENMHGLALGNEGCA